MKYEFTSHNIQYKVIKYDIETLYIRTWIITHSCVIHFLKTHLALTNITVSSWLAHC